MKDIHEWKSVTNLHLALDCLFHYTPETKAEALKDHTKAYEEHNTVDVPAAEAIVMNLWGRRALKEMALRVAGKLLKNMSPEERKGYFSGYGISQ